MYDGDKQLLYDARRLFCLLLAVIVSRRLFFVRSEPAKISIRDTRINTNNTGRACECREFRKSVVQIYGRDPGTITARIDKRRSYTSLSGDPECLL